MTKIEFMIACEAACIDPAIALESDSIIEALKDKDAARVILVLETEF